MNAKRAILRIQLDLAAKQHLDRLSKTLGMTQISIMSRLVEWFVRQNQLVQLCAMGALSSDLSAPLAKDLLEQMQRAEQQESSPAAARGGTNR